MGKNIEALKRIETMSLFNRTNKEELKILKKYFAISLEQICTAHEEIKDCERIIHEDMTYHIMFIENDVYKEYGFHSDVVAASITKEEYEILKRWIDE